MTEPKALEDNDFIENEIVIAIDREEVDKEHTSSDAWREAHKLNDALEKKTLKRQEKIIIALTIVCIVEILLVFGVIVAVTNDQNAQGVVNSQVLCPLYEIFKSSESAQTRQAATNKAAYDQFVQDIQHSIDVLGCTHP